MATGNRSHILLFDSPTTICRRSAEFLTEAGYRVDHLTNPSELTKELISSTDLIVMSELCDEKFYETAETVQSLFPSVPRLVIRNSHNPKAHPKLKKGAHYGAIRALASRKALLRKVKHLLFMGKTLTKLERQDFELDMIRHADKVLGSLKRAELVNASFSIFETFLKAKQVYWFSYKTLKSFEEADIFRGHQNRLSEEELQDFKHFALSPKDAQKLAHEMSGVLKDSSAEDWFVKAPELKVFPIENPTLSIKHVVPILNLQKSTVLGYFFVEDSLLAFHLLSMESCEAILKRVSQAFTLAHFYRGTKALTYVDDLTHLYNQRYLAKILDTEIARAARLNGQFTILFIDVDHLKKVNDKRGHLVGSKLIVEVSRVLSRNIRNTDYAFRYGGDEFILLLVGADTKASRVVAERIRADVARSAFTLDGEEIRVTLSIGIASFPEHAQTKEEILKLADEAMYEGKKHSRNIVFVAS